MFKNHMNKALKHVQDAVGCTLIGFDGVPIASVFSEDGQDCEAPLLAISIEASAMLRKMHRMASEDELPFVKELNLVSDELTALTKVDQHEYLLVLALKTGGDLETGQRMLDLLTPWIESEM